MLAYHVEKAVDNTSDVDCVTYHAIVLDSVLCQSPRHTRQANEIHALTILFLNTQYCVTGRNRPNRIRFIKIVVISHLYSGPMPLNIACLLSNGNGNHFYLPKKYFVIIR